jgi:hypothetical protein
MLNVRGYNDVVLLTMMAFVVVGATTLQSGLKPERQSDIMSLRLEIEQPSVGRLPTMRGNSNKKY